MHNKKLETFGKVKLPIQFGTTLSQPMESLKLAFWELMQFFFTVLSSTARASDFFGAGWAWPGSLAGNLFRVSKESIDFSTHHDNVPSHIKRRRSYRENRKGILIHTE